MKNKDDECLRWAIRAALFPAQAKVDRPSSYPRDDGLDFTGIDFPTPLSQISKIEEQNNLAITVFGWCEGKTVVVRVSEVEDPNTRRIHLMMLTDKHTTHYCYIKSLSRLLASEYAAGRKIHFCDRCLQGFSSERVLNDHLFYCRGVKGRPARVEMPKKGENALFFENYQNQMKKPWVIYADFESIVEKIHGCTPDPGQSSTTETSVHKPCGFCMLAVRSDGETKGPYLYRGEDTVRAFLYYLQLLESEIREELLNKAKLKMTRADWADFNSARDCHICSKPLIKENERDAIGVYDPDTGKYAGLVHRHTNKCYQNVYNMYTQSEDGQLLYYPFISPRNKRQKPPKNTLDQEDCLFCGEPLIQNSFRDAVKDHCHITGEYRGAAHGYCNINYFRTNPKTEVIPVIFHNLKGYDAHHIMSGIAEVQSDLKCIPNNMEKYVSFSLGKLRFIDSLGFLQSSLDSLVGTNKPESFTIMASHEEDPARRKLLLQKGHYPYEYMDAWSRFEETALPPKEAFYSELKREGISDDDYAHAQAVWQAFECKNLGDFHDKYLETDVLLLADVVENFRETCLKHYKLDPAHYYTSPSLSWDALLKYTGINLELLTDVNKHLFVERGLRGGISMESRRYCKANNRHLSDYNPQEETSYIMYYNANNLYGWAMSQPLPVGKFEWCLAFPTLHQIRRWRSNRKIGYILEVDLDYPEELHDEHNAYPLAPEKQVVPKEWMSPYQRALAGGQPEDKTTKLLLTLRNKTWYVLHYRALQQYLDLGMRLRKIHKILKFEQRVWMEPYISLNTELRKRATSDFEKNFFKLMNNSVFGKTMENLRNRIDVKLVRSHEEDKLRKLIASPLFARATVFSNTLASIQMNKSKIIFKRPIYTGMCILDLSKTLMYDFYYKHLKLKYGPRVDLLYTDTDSLLLEIKTEDVYKDMENLRDELYDTSDYPKDHPLHSQLNKKVIGKMKDKCSGKPISEVVCLRSKMYSILLEGDKNIKKAKGTTKVVTKKEIKHQNYKEALFGLRTFKHGMSRLRSKGHQIFGEHLTKTTLSPFDSKRWIKEDGINTLAYGHKDAR